MKLLLDTHIWLWALLEPERLSPAVRAALQAEGNELWLSPVSVWAFASSWRQASSALRTGV